MARQRHAKKIDTVHWTVTNPVESVLVGAGTVGINLAPAQHLPETLLRLRGGLSIGLAGGLTAGSGLEVGVGIILVPEGTSTTVLWSPLTDGDAPWIWWGSYSLEYNEYVADVIARQITPEVRVVVDSKAMRKIRNTELQMVIERVAITGLTAVNASVLGRFRVLAGS